uniref:Uncharacterized protein n=1 Tax=Siphoviridae sp. ctENB54 TaxID=2827815 RepID=A0A8S5TE71_9CAUD|nr:MAG TPA: hypothetical protein [Siphoviridae sp. ctENB54]
MDSFNHFLMPCRRCDLMFIFNVDGDGHLLISKG